MPTAATSTPAVGTVFNTPTVAQPASEARVASKALGAQDFLKLMVAELTHQDPFKATDTSRMMENFMSMGNFQSMQEMNLSVGRMTSYTMGNYAQALVGRSVEVKVPDDSELPGQQTRVDGDGKPFQVITGTVTGSRIEGRSVYITVQGVELDAAGVVAFSDAPVPASASNPPAN